MTFGAGAIVLMLEPREHVQHGPGVELVTRGKEIVSGRARLQSLLYHKRVCMQVLSSKELHVA